MRLFLNILKTGTILIILITLILFSASLLMQNKVAGIILNAFNKDISTKFNISSVRLSFLKRFPKATLALKNAIILSSPDFDRTCFSGTSSDTLLSAESVYLEFNIRDIRKGIYNIERISIREGTIRLLSDTAGLVNYNITDGNKEKSNNNLTINLEGINLGNIKAFYDNRATNLFIQGVIKNGKLKSKIAGDNIDFTAKGGLIIDTFRLSNVNISRSIETEVDVNLHSSIEGVHFDKGTIIFDNNKFGLSGFISSDDLLDLAVTGENIDVSGIKNYLPEELINKLAVYHPSGILSVESRIRGPLARTSNPGIEIRFSLVNGRVTYGNSSLAINNMSFNGLFTNGSGKIPETSSLIFSNFTGTLGSSTYTGSLALSDFKSLKGDLQLKGELIPSELKEFFNINDISSSEGSVYMNLRMKGIIPKAEKYKVTDLLSLKTIADLTFNTFGIGFKNDKIRISNTTGNLSLSETIVARDFQFTYKDHRIILNGKFINLPDWLSGAPVTMTASATIECDRVIVESILPQSSKTDSSSARKKVHLLPGDIIFNLNFDIGSFTYKTFQAENVMGTLSYRPRILNFKSLQLNSMNGSISGDGFIVQNRDKTYYGRGTFNLNEININKAFSVFKNFGQDFLKAENLAGTVSGSLSVLIPTDSVFRPVTSSISAEGKYLISDGALVSFEPVRALSKFIEISELENISFERLENDFFIRNNYLYIPQMDVKSSAADLSINGRHSFNNDYEYHVKILLSEILSRKIRTPRLNTTEFGAVKDDGLGRTSLLLKIGNIGDNVKVGYDIKAAGNQIKSDFRKERQTLKSILNEEYGWFRNDSSVRQKPSTAEPRFKITWEEADTIEVKPEEPASGKKDNIIRNLFKKNQF